MKNNFKRFKTSLLKVMSLYIVLAILMGSVIGVEARNSQSFLDWFPNAELASYVAGQFNRTSLDSVTQAELSTITSFSLGWSEENVGLSSIEELAPLTGLVTLDLRAQKIKDFKGVGAFPNLTSLNATLMSVESMEGIEEAKSLTNLSLGNGYSSSFYQDVNVLSPVFSLTSLKTLLIRSGELENEHLEGLSSLTSLEQLNLDSNYIKDLEYIKDVPSLLGLSLSDNRLNSIAGLQSLVFLKSIEIGNSNPILGANGILDFSFHQFYRDDIYSNENYVAMYFDRLAIQFPLEFDDANNLYFIDLNLLIPSSDTAVPTYFENSDVNQRNIVLNTDLNRLEIPADKIGLIDFTKYLIDVNLVTGSNHNYGRVFIFIEEMKLPMRLRVDFVTNGGTDVVPLVDLEPGDGIGFFNHTERENYNFTGWYKDEALTERWDIFEDKVYTDITLYAGWQAAPTYRVDFEGNGGSFTEPYLEVFAGNKIDIPQEPVRVDYGFRGWYLDEALTERWDFFEDEVYEDTILYASWEFIPTYYRVDFEGNGGSFTDPYLDVLKGSVIEEPVAPTKEGHTFLGWYKDEGLLELWDFTEEAIFENTTLYASWEFTPTYYRVDFEGNGGSFTDPYLDVLKGSIIEEPIAPSKEGYTFLGWYKDEELSELWDFAEEAIFENTTLYASWEVDELVSIPEPGLPNKEKENEPLPDTGIGNASRLFAMSSLVSGLYLVMRKKTEE